MRRIFRYLFSGWFKLPAVSSLEGFFLRLLFAVVLVYTLRGFDQFTDEPHPVGLLKLLKWFNSDISFAWISEPANFEIYRWIFIGMVLVYVSGFALPIVLPIVALMHIVPFTLYNSQGFTHHGYQIVSLALLFQACTAIYAAFSQGKAAWLFPNGKFLAWMLIQTQVLITGGYLCSVVTKIDNSNGMWLYNSNYIAMDMVKTERQNYLNRFDPQYQENEHKAIWYLERPWVSRAVFGSGFILEAICIVAIGHRFLGFILGVSLIVMHRSIDKLMNLSFLYNEYLCLIFLAGLPFALAWLFERIPWKTARLGFLSGLLAGLPVSYWFQTERIQVRNGWGEYVVELANLLGYWGNWNAEHFFNYTAPIFQAVMICGAAGLVIGTLIHFACQKKADPVTG